MYPMQDPVVLRPNTSLGQVYHTDGTVSAPAAPPRGRESPAVAIEGGVRMRERSPPAVEPGGSHHPATA